MSTQFVPGSTSVTRRTNLPFATSAGTHVWPQLSAAPPSVGYGDVGKVPVMLRVFWLVQVTPSSQDS